MYQLRFPPRPEKDIGSSGAAGVGIFESPAMGAQVLNPDLLQKMVSAVNCLDIFFSLMALVVEEVRVRSC